MYSCPEERIEQARLEMQLKRAQARLHKQDDRELWQALLQEEYDKLSLQIQHYYANRKQLLEQRKRKALARYDRLKLQLEYRNLRMASSLPNATGVACWPASPETLRSPDQEDRLLAVFLYAPQRRETKKWGDTRMSPPRK